MPLLNRPVDVDLHCRFTYKEPLYDRMNEQARIDMLKRLVAAFEIRLNDVKFKSEEPSDRFFTLSKLYGSSFLSVAFGFEEGVVGLRNPPTEDFVTELCSRFSQLLGVERFKTMIFNIREHCQSSGDLKGFLERLAPNTPSSFGDFLTGRGAFFTLYFPEQRLAASVTVTNSLYVENGLFLGIDLTYEPFEGSLIEASSKAKTSFDQILEGLDLKFVSGE